MKSGGRGWLLLLLWRSIPLLFSVVFGASAAQAIELNLSGKTFRVFGQIEAGDAEKFSNFIHTLPHDELGDLDLRLSLESPGGNLFEGMRLGDAIRSAKLPTLVERGRECYSACAIAFLGGTISGATKDGISRQLENGAILGFHGFKLSNDTLRLENESLNEARIVNAIILDYASRLGGIDLGFFARLLNTSPSEISPINTPEGIKALSVTLTGTPLKLSSDWPNSACLNAVRGELDALDPLGPDSRLRQGTVPTKNLAEFSSKLLNDKYPPEAGTFQIRSSLGRLPPSQAIDVLSGQSLYVDLPGSKAVYRVALERGAGFYFDSCFAVTDFRGIYTVLVDGVSHRSDTRYWNLLGGFSYRAPLW